MTQAMSPVPTNNNDPEAVLVIATAGSEAEAVQLARAAVERQLAACVQIMPIRSVYVWQAQIHDEPELLLLFKTRRAQYPALEACIREQHSYDVPEILMLPVQAGLPAYLAWLAQQTGGTPQ